MRSHKVRLGYFPGLNLESSYRKMDTGSEGMALVRLYSELRSRACMCLSRQCEDSEEFKELFVSECNNDLNQLRKQVENVKPGQKNIIIILVLFY